jgi:hypothetical protein
MRKDDKGIRDAIEYLDRLGEATFASGGMPAIKKLNETIENLRRSLTDVQPCVCDRPHICDFNDRCCKNG